MSPTNNLNDVCERSLELSARAVTTPFLILSTTSFQADDASKPGIVSCTV